MGNYFIEAAPAEGDEVLFIVSIKTKACMDSSIDCDILTHMAACFHVLVECQSVFLGW